MEGTRGISYSGRNARHHSPSTTNPSRPSPPTTNPPQLSNPPIYPFQLQVVVACENEDDEANALPIALAHIQIGMHTKCKR